jgi:glycosyltransferase involved in cell wall biosynthesis
MASATSTDGHTAISVIMATWNNARRLRITLEALRCAAPEGLRWELVLVANNCTDDTALAARSFHDRLPLVYIEEPRQGLSHARNAGLRSARGRLIVFTDDDITPCRDWTDVYWRAYCERREGYYFGGRLIPQFESGPPPPELMAFASLPITGLDWGNEPRLLREEEKFLGANWSCPAEALRRAGGFDTRLGLDASLGRRRVGEEWDVMDRLRAIGVMPWYLPTAVVTHFVPAHKCRLGYFADNWEAHGHYATLRSAHFTPFLRRRPHLRPVLMERGATLAGAPWRAYWEAARFGLRSMLARTAGSTDHAAYLSWRFAVGAIRGHRERRSEKRKLLAASR